MLISWRIKRYKIMMERDPLFIFFFTETNKKIDWLNNVLRRIDNISAI